MTGFTIDAAWHVWHCLWNYYFFQTFQVLFVEPLIPLFWTSHDVSFCENITLKTGTVKNTRVNSSRISTIRWPYHVVSRLWGGGGWAEVRLTWEICLVTCGGRWVCLTRGVCLLTCLAVCFSSLAGSAIYRWGGLPSHGIVGMQSHL